jgi:spore germination protein GerM
MIHLRGWRRALTVVIALTIAGGACAIPRDSSPRPIPREAQQPLSEAGTPGPAGSEVFGPRVYFLRDDPEGGATEAVPVSRNVAATAEAVLSALFDGRTSAETDAPLRTSIPTGTRLLGARIIAQRTLQVDVTEQLFDAESDAQIEAVAQIVYTATALQNVDRVRLLVEGEPRDWLVGDGSLVSGTLTRFMYPGFAGSTRPAFPPIPSPDPPPTTTP